MRTQTLIFGIACGYAVLAATAVLTQQRTARVAAEKSPAVAAAGVGQSTGQGVLRAPVEAPLAAAHTSAPDDHRQPAAQLPATRELGLLGDLRLAELTAEASALIDRLILEHPGDEQAIRRLFELDPVWALDNVEPQMAASRGPAELRGTLVRLLVRSGDVPAVEAVLARAARDGHVIASDEWGLVAELWLNADETARGQAALQRALGQEHGDPDQWVQQLAELAPGELLLALERRVASDEVRNDEYWGSLADSYWAAGRQAEARSAWERASSLDPEDREWPARLQALYQGRDPFED